MAGPVMGCTVPPAHMEHLEHPGTPGTPGTPRLFSVNKFVFNIISRSIASGSKSHTCKFERYFIPIAIGIDMTKEKKMTCTAVRSSHIRTYPTIRDYQSMAFSQLYIKFDDRMLKEDIVFE
jgi:hypothetical protein